MPKNRKTNKELHHMSIQNSRTQGQETFLAPSADKQTRHDVDA